MYDVAVVGAGPAGSAVALSALRSRPGARVLLLDKAAFPRDKSCGDGIAPHALDELARLGAAHVLADRVPVRRLRLRSPAGAEAATELLRPDFVVPRQLLDARLVDAAVTRGAELVRHGVRRVELRAGSVVLDDTFEARVVVGADGANGVVRRLLGVPRQRGATVAVAVRGYADAPAGEPEQLIVMDDQDWPAYAWSFAAGDGTANVGFGMLLPSLKAADGGREALHGRLLELLPGISPTRLRSHHLPLSTGRPRLPPGRVLLAGDAASLVNPLTGEGIFYALLSGRLAGLAAVGGGDRGPAYAAAGRDGWGPGPASAPAAAAREGWDQGLASAAAAAAGASRDPGWAHAAAAGGGGDLGWAHAAAAGGGGDLGSGRSAAAPGGSDPGWASAAAAEDNWDPGWARAAAGEEGWDPDWARAAAAEEGWDPGSVYAGMLQRELGRHLRHTTVLARLTAHPRVLEAGVRAAGRSPGAMDALVEVGLGRGLVTRPLLRAMAGELMGSARRRLA